MIQRFQVYKCGLCGNIVEALLPAEVANWFVAGKNGIAGKQDGRRGL